jgi:23S rRNA (guanosine2251-2'-O)-methyltransferase
MSLASYEIRLCQSCGLRYPLTDKHSFGKRCPICLGTTQRVLSRQTTPETATLAIESGIQLEALLDNIRSAWNVGSIFRTADGLGVSKLYLCGITPTPDNEAVRKTSLGAEETVAWEYSRNALKTAKTLKSEGYRLIALEQDPRAFPIDAFLSERSHTQSKEGQNAVNGQRAVKSKDILVLGNEVIGVDPDLLDLCDQIVHIPMRGRKRSLNVEVAFAITAFHLSRDQARD